MNPPDPEQTTILLVDDEQSVRSIVMKILQRAKYKVLEAENGDAAIRISDTHPDKIDLVISDMYMPGLRGPEVGAGAGPEATGTSRPFHVGIRRSGFPYGRAAGRQLSEQAFFGQGAGGEGRRRCSKDRPPS